VLGLIAGVALGHAGLGVALLTAAFANRMIQAIVVGGWLLHDVRATRLCWLYPLRDLEGFAIWCASYLSRDFYWRGEMYRFTTGGRIIAKERQSSGVTVG
jgi:ceramide glucosyltransferase